MAGNKLTIDLLEKNREILEKIKAENRSPYGATINGLIDTFCTIPNSVKKELLTYIKPKIRNLYREMDGASEFSFKELSEKAQAYMDIATFLNDGNPLSMNEIDNTTTMVRYPMLDGYLICPDNWIIVNPDEAERSTYAFVIECRNAGEYKIPHLLVFINRKSSYDYSDLEKKVFLSECCKVYPRFSDILALQVDPIDDPDHPGCTLNAKEWLEAPNIGYFDIYVQGDPEFSAGYKPVLGARIVKTTEEEN